MDVIVWLLALTGMALLVALLVGVCCLKGRWMAAVAAVLGAILPPVAAVLALSPSDGFQPGPYILLGLVGIALFLFAWMSAFRRARPRSWWARRLSKEDASERARTRVGE